MSIESLTVLFLATVFATSLIPVQWEKSGILYCMSLFPIGLGLVLFSFVINWGRK